MPDRLADIAAEVTACTRCPLAETRTNSVPGNGDPTSPYLFIGEAPGSNEDAQGLPFVGNAGNVLNRLIEGIGLEREEVFVTNIVKCRPPDNRDPEPAEIDACSGYLRRQIELMDPEAIITLGRFSMNHFIPGERISRIHGSSHEVDGRIIIAMYHPAASLHQPGLADTLAEDFRQIPEVVAAARARTEPAPSPDPESTSATDPDSEPDNPRQLTLF
jgi:uracil-DNA glycosylase